MKKKILRPAVAMIELIFAIMIMAIVLLSAPEVIRTATQSGYVAIQQEAINEAASRLSLVLTYPWDENNVDANFIPPVLFTTNGDASLNQAAFNRRAGTPNVSYRSFVRADGQTFFASLPLGLEANDGTTPDDMDDFNGQSGLIVVEAAQSDEDYIDTQVRLTIRANYTTDGVQGGDTYLNPGGDNMLVFVPFNNAPAGQTTNIKAFTLTLTTANAAAELQKTVVLRAFSCNIGGTMLEERTF
jgi:hypothetical protein